MIGTDAADALSKPLARDLGLGRATDEQKARAVMGIFGALNNAVSGLKAQSYALEQISGNIANSQTVGYKRAETSFADMVMDAAPSRQSPGGVNAFTRATNDVQGSLQRSDVETFMAVQGDGYFVVAQQIGEVDNNPVFNDTNAFTRRGDFQINRAGYLVNGSGYYLQGLPIDPTTGNAAGASPEPVLVQSDFLAARPTGQIDYRLNLARYPLTANADPAIPRSELLNPANFTNDPTVMPPTTTNGFIQANDLPLFLQNSLSGGATTVFDDSGSPVNVQFRWAKTASTLTSNASIAISNYANDVSGGATGLTNSPSGSVAGTAYTPIDLTGGASPAVAGSLTSTDPYANVDLSGVDTVTVQIAVDGGTQQTITVDSGSGPAPVDPANVTQAEFVAMLNQELDAAFGAGVVAASVSGTEIQIASATPGASSQVAIGTVGGTLAGTTGLDTLGSQTSVNGAAAETVDSITFDIAIDGGTTQSITINEADALALPVANAAAITGDELAALINAELTAVGVDATASFDAGAGALNIQSIVGGDPNDEWRLFYQTNSSASGTDAAWVNTGTAYTFSANGTMIAPTEDPVLTFSVNGSTVSDVRLRHGGGISQFSDPSGNAQLTALSQNGYAAGELVGVSISDAGRVVAAYSNGQVTDLAEVAVATFNGDSQLRKLEGGAFRATRESGDAIIVDASNVVGNSLEASNVDISDEFTKLIVTQQAYSAATRIVSVSDEMMQEVLSMVR